MACSREAAKQDTGVKAAANPRLGIITIVNTRVSSRLEMREPLESNISSITEALPLLRPEGFK